MLAKFPPEQREELVKELTLSLEDRSMSSLRQIAKLWGWPVKGTAKIALVQAIAANLSDPATMVSACAALPAMEVDALAWASVMPGRQNPLPSLAAILAQSTGKAISESELAPILHDLYERGLLDTNSPGGYAMPVIFNEWLQGLAPAALVVEEPTEATPSMSAAAFSLHVDNLLSFIASDAPTIKAPVSDFKPKEVKELTPGPGPVTSDLLQQWGYTSLEEQHMARFLVTAMVYSGLVRVAYHKTPARLTVDAAQVAVWQTLSPVQQQAAMARIWLQQAVRPGDAMLSGGLAWNEFDLALDFHRQQRSEFALCQSNYYYGATGMVASMAGQTRLIMSASTHILRGDTWYRFDRFCTVVRALSPDILSVSTASHPVYWARGGSALDPNSLDPATWLATYGSQVAAWLTGPARWLGLVEVAFKAGRLVAFQRPQESRAPQHVDLPSDALSFLPDGRLVLRSIWQAAELRDLVRQIAALGTRDRSTMTFHLDPAVFRTSMRHGATANQLIEAFAGRGFPLPIEMQQRIVKWESHAGRFHIYDNLAAIELGDDLALREVESAAALGQRRTYPASARCLLLLEPDSVAGIVDSLQRRGYMPKVTS